MAAAATLTIAAESLGVASAAIEPFDPARLKDAFGIPDDHAIACLIALGHAAETPPFPGRLPLADVAFEEHFGQPWRGGEGPWR
jgi:nitroreductase